MAQLLPTCCSVHYENENDLSSFLLIVKPTEGYWDGGVFRFQINVTDEYNMVVSIRCPCEKGPFNAVRICLVAASSQMPYEIVAPKYNRIRGGLFVAPQTSQCRWNGLVSDSKT